MASYHCSVKNGSVGYGKNHFLYIQREGQYQKKLNYEKLISKNSYNLPSWADNKPSVFWEATDTFERKNGRSYKEIEIALPNELSHDENIKFVEDYCKNMFSDKHVYSYAIHDKKATLNKNEQNIHAHIMFCEREINHDRKEPLKSEYFSRPSLKKNGVLVGGFKKNRDWNKKDFVIELRKDFEIYQNQILQEKDFEIRVSSDSLDKQKEKAIELGDKNLEEFFDREAPKRFSPLVIYACSDEINKILSKEISIDDIDNPLARELAQDVIIREAKKEIILTKLIQSHVIDAPKNYDITSNDILERIISNTIAIDKEVNQLDTQKEIIQKAINSNSNYTKKAFFELSNGYSKELLEKIRSKKSLLEYNQKQIQLEPENATKYQEYINKIKPELELHTNELNKLSKKYPLEQVNELENKFKDSDLAKLQKLTVAINDLNKQKEQLSLATKNISTYSYEKYSNEYEKSTFTKDKTKYIDNIISDLGTSKNEFVAQNEVIDFLKSRLTELEEKIKTQIPFNTVRSDRYYTKKAYNELTQGKSNELLEKIRSKKSLLEYNRKQIQLEPENAIKYQMYIDKFTPELELHTNELNKLTKQYSLEQVNGLENKYRAEDNDNLNIQQNSRLEIMQEITLIKNILGKDKDIFDKSFIEEVSRDPNYKKDILENLNVKQRVKNIAEKLLSWEMSQTIKGKSLGLENDIEYK